jgi:hypothetical protein
VLDCSLLVIEVAVWFVAYRSCLIQLGMMRIPVLGLTPIGTRSGRSQMGA